MTDSQHGQAGAEATDDEKLDGEYPPDRPLAVEDYGTTGAEQRIEEPLTERVAREEPDDLGAAGDVGDPFAGEPATEREAPTPAEVDAIHRTEPPPYRERDSYVDDDDSS
jgi:hypothetical protein